MNAGENYIPLCSIFQKKDPILENSDIQRLESIYKMVSEHKMLQFNTLFSNWITAVKAADCGASSSLVYMKYVDGYQELHDFVKNDATQGIPLLIHEIAGGKEQSECYMCAAYIYPDIAEEVGEHHPESNIALGYENCCGVQDEADYMVLAWLQHH